MLTRLIGVALTIMIACGAVAAFETGGGSRISVGVKSKQTANPQGITIMGATGSGGIRIEPPAVFSGLTTAYQPGLAGWKRCRWNGSNENSVLSDCVDWPPASGGASYSTLPGDPMDSAALAALLNAKAGLVKPTFQGYSVAAGTIAKVPTAAPGNTTQVANMAAVSAAVGGAVSKTAAISTVTTLANGTLYKVATGTDIHTLPATSANGRIGVFSTYSAVKIKGATASDYFIDVKTGTATAAGYSIKMPKFAECWLSSYANDNVWLVNCGASAIEQSVLSYSVYTINDDFSSNTIANYTSIAQTMTITGGSAHGTTWNTTVYRHNTATGSNDHWAQATVSNQSSDYGGIVVGNNGGAGYYVAFITGNTVRVQNTNSAWFATNSTGTFPNGTYALKVQIDTDGSSRARFNVWVNNVKYINDASDTTSSVTRGQYIGTYFRRTSANSDVVVDNLIAASGSAP